MLMNDTVEIMYVLKRDGTKETVSFDKVSNRLRKLIKMKGKSLEIDYIKLAQRVCADIYPGVETCELDELAAQICACMITEHRDYGELASRLSISNHHKKTSPSFSEVIEQLRCSKNSRGELVTIVSDELYNIVKKNKDKLNQVIDYDRDYLLDYFGYKTLEKSYLLKSDKKIVERPQHLFMRVALGIHGSDLKDAIECYHYLSLKKCIHATPTLFNAGTTQGQLASCFLMGINEDSINGIYDSLKDCALISKMAGGIGIHIHDIRSRGSLIAGGMGVSNGIVPMLRVFNNTARYVDQGGGKRNGSFAIYIEPWHGDILEFLEMKKNQGAEEARARDLFYALWIPDLFMKRVQENGNWTLMCPHECPGLPNVYGEDFNKLYTKYENEGKGTSIPAQELWFKILESQIETGTPYMLYKDACNQKSNQKNLGTIRSSNLCCEIVEYSGERNSMNETAVCNLASISLPNFVIGPKKLNGAKIKLSSKKGCIFCKLAEDWCQKWDLSYEVIFNEKHTTYPQIYVEKDGNKEHVGGYEDFVEKYPADYDYDGLRKSAMILTKNLNKVIDRTTYPIDSGKSSNLLHRPIGLGVQGLADVFFKMKISFDSECAREINSKIFETIYYGALNESLSITKKRELMIRELSSDPTRDDLRSNLKLIPEETSKIKNGKKYIGAYSSFEGSPMSYGKFQFDLWDGKPKYEFMEEHDWDGLREEVMKHGIRNSLLVAPMPTASTAQILGNTECFEAITSNIYVRRTLAGEFIILNKYLQEDLYTLGLWNEEMKNEILKYEGSVQEIDKIPKYIKNIYKTVWNISQKTIIDMAADRGRFICQSQSMNLFQTDPKFDTLTSMYFYAWKSGLKTGLYYLRIKPRGKAQTFTITPVKETNDSNDSKYEICESCSG